MGIYYLILSSTLLVIDRFVDEKRGDAPAVCGVDDAVMATHVAFAAIKAVRERRTVSLDEV